MEPAPRRRQRTIYAVTLAAMIAMIGGYALAATSVTTLAPQQSSGVTQSPSPGGFTGIVTVHSESLVILSAGMTGSATGGTQTAGAVGLSGTTTQLAACTGACVEQNFRSASPTTEVTGDFGEQLVLNAFQSTANSAIGFDMSIAVSITVGSTTSTVTSFMYLEMPTSGTTETIPVYLFVDLETSTAPA
ncbi:MAG: hypothetical protein WCA77_04075, partial [Thermoplasmata archaeon]